MHEPTRHVDFRPPSPLSIIITVHATQKALSQLFQNENVCVYSKQHKHSDRAARKLSHTYHSLQHVPALSLRPAYFTPPPQRECIDFNVRPTSRPYLLFDLAVSVMMSRTLGSASLHSNHWGNHHVLHGILWGNTGVVLNGKGRDNVRTVHHVDWYIQVVSFSSYPSPPG